MRSSRTRARPGYLGFVRGGRPEHEVSVARGEQVVGDGLPAEVTADEHLRLHVESRVQLLPQAVELASVMCKLWWTRALVSVEAARPSMLRTIVWVTVGVCLRRKQRRQRQRRRQGNPNPQPRDRSINKRHPSVLRTQRGLQLCGDKVVAVQLTKAMHLANLQRVSSQATSPFSQRIVAK